MSSARWERLAEDLRAAGFDVRLDAKAYQQTYRGRPESGVSYSVFFKIPGKGAVGICDKWWTKNPGKWVGWEVWAEGTDSITIGRPSRWTKKYSEAVEAFRAAVKTVEAR